MPDFEWGWTGEKRRDDYPGPHYPGCLPTVLFVAFMLAILAGVLGCIHYG